ncbi:hypothetical protein B484DRAFT_457979 [Ochromonadaceae sp. CCMP2298]|nr:hypothetical protein B484DRAFT_457979 [Ochromonadaceae sp. CCMP2298]
MHMISHHITIYFTTLLQHYTITPYHYTTISHIILHIPLYPYITIPMYHYTIIPLQNYTTVPPYHYTTITRYTYTFFYLGWRCEEVGSGAVC